MNNWPSHVTKTRHLASRQNRPHLCLHFKFIQTSKQLTKTNSRRPLFRLRQAGSPIQSQFSSIRTAFSFSSMGMFFSTGKETRTSQFIRLLSICTKIPKMSILTALWTHSLCNAISAWNVLWASGVFFLVIWGAYRRRWIGKIIIYRFRPA